ncbi:MAG: radical SAM protein [Thermoproteota archaeon]|nr:radical SAM protein [Thermoproteota archaeon]
MAVEKNEDYKIVLTADRTLMSDYHRHEFVGFGSCAPPNVIPDWLYKALFFPPIKTNSGTPIAAPYGLRKIEAQLISEGFQVLTVDPDRLDDHIHEAKVLGITVMDPFGMGPASSTFASILKKEPFLAQYFRSLMDKPELKRAKKRGLKIIVGGSGTWQFHFRPKFVKEYGINCIVEGEAEKVVGPLVRAALNGEELPQYYEVDVKETPSVEEIPNIVAPSVNGLVEIGRGCCRGCKFCSVTLRPLRWYPLDKILAEIKVNLDSGYTNGALLHAEDIMLYGSKNTMPKRGKLLKLHKLVTKRCEGIGWSHASLAAIAVNPKLLPELAQIILNDKQKLWGAEIGIETGSPELMKKAMPAKTHPFKPEEWPEVVKTSMGIMHDNMLVPACTLIVGLPEETDEDLVKTIELMDDLKDFRSLIVPLFFVPMGRLKNEDWFKEEEMNKLHKDLLIQCLRHDLHWINELIKMSFEGGLRRIVLRFLYGLFVKIIEYKARKAELTSQ